MEWPGEVSGDAIERACAAARMGVDTAIVLGSDRLRTAVEANLLELAKDAVFDPRYDVATWVFKDGGELMLTINLLAAKSAHWMRHRSGPRDLEIVYPKSGRV